MALFEATHRHEPMIMPLWCQCLSVFADALIPALHSKHQKSSISRSSPKECIQHYVEKPAADLNYRSSHGSYIASSSYVVMAHPPDSIIHERSGICNIVVSMLCLTFFASSLPRYVTSHVDRQTQDKAKVKYVGNRVSSPITSNVPAIYFCLSS